MSALSKLLDKAAATCSPANQSGLAARLGVSRSLISSWKTGAFVIPAERVAEIARIGHLDPAEWVVLVEAEQAKGEARKAYSSLVKRLGIAALLAIVTVPALASVSHITAGTAYYVRVRRLVTRLLGSLERRRSLPHAALLAL